MKKSKRVVSMLLSVVLMCSMLPVEVLAEEMLIPAENTLLLEEPEEATAEPTEEPEEATAEPTEEPEEATAEPTEEPEEATAEPTEEPEEATAEPTEEAEEATAEPTEEPEEATAEPTTEPEEATAEPETATELEKVELQIESEWKLSDGGKTLTIVYEAEAEEIELKWKHEEAVKYEIETSSVPEGNEEEQRKHLKTTEEAKCELKIAEYQEGNYILYITAEAEDGRRSEMSQCFRLEKKEEESGENQQLLSEEWESAAEAPAEETSEVPEVVEVETEAEITMVWYDEGIEKEALKIHVSTNLEAEKLYLYQGEQLLSEWRASEAKIDEYANVKEWHVEYTFEEPGAYYLWYRASNDGETQGKGYTAEPVEIKRPSIIGTWYDEAVEKKPLKIHVTTNLEMEELYLCQGENVLGSWKASELSAEELTEYATCKEWHVEYTFDEPGAYYLWYKASDGSGNMGRPYEAERVEIKRPSIIGTWYDEAVEKKPLKIHVTTNLEMEELYLCQGENVLRSWKSSELSEEELTEYATCKEWHVEHTFDEPGAYYLWYKASDGNGNMGQPYEAERVEIKRPSIIGTWYDEGIEKEPLKIHVTTNLEMEELYLCQGENVLGSWKSSELSAEELTEYATCKEWHVEYTFDEPGPYYLWYKASDGNGNMGQPYEAEEVKINRPAIITRWYDEGIEKEPLKIHVTTNLEMEELYLCQGENVLGSWKASELSEEELTVYATCKEWHVEYTFEEPGEYYLWYKASDAEGNFGRPYDASEPVQIKRPAIIAVKYNEAIAKEPTELQITTNLEMNHVYMYCGDEELCHWTSEETDIVEYASCKDWTVSYTFEEAGEYKLWYKASADGAELSRAYASEALIVGEAGAEGEEDLPAPEWISAEQTGAGEVTLKWNQIEEADGYVIYMATEEDGEYGIIAETAFYSKEWTVHQLTCGQTYYFRINAYKCSDTMHISANGSQIISVQIQDWASREYEYVIEDNACTITGYVGSDTVVNVPEEIEDYPVVGIGEYAFSQASDVQAINLPKNLERIGIWAFSNCTSLESITIPSCMNYLGKYAFENCISLKRIVIPEGVDDIGWGAFSGCTSLESVILPQSVRCISSEVFVGCTALTGINLPESIEEMGSNVFGGCPNVTATVVEGSYAHNWCVENGITFTLAETSVATPVEAFEYTDRDGETVTITGYIGEYTDVIIPAEIHGMKVVEIGECAFEEKNITSVKIPEGVEIIGANAFAYCYGLKNAELPSTLKTLGRLAFTYCDLQSVSFPEGLRTIGDSAFGYNQSIRTIHIPASVISVTAGAFYGCDSLHSLSIDDANTAYMIDGDVLYSKDGTVFVMWMGQEAEYSVSEGVIEIGEDAFGWGIGRVTLTKVILPESLESIGDSAFRQCVYLEHVVMPKCVRVEGFAFYLCQSLKTIELSPEISYIGSWAFQSCPNMTAIVEEGSYAHNWCIENDVAFAFEGTLEPDPEPVDGYVYEKMDDGTVRITGYIGTDTDIVIPAEINGLQVTEIGESAFEAKNIASVSIPEGVITIGNGAFRDNMSLKQVNLPSTLRTVARSAFYQCDLQALELPEGLETIEGFAFAVNQSLKSVVIPNTVKEIGESAFWGCMSLESVDIPAGVEFIGSNAFKSCPNVTATVVEGSYAHNWCIENEVAFMLSATPAEYFEYSEKDDGTAAITKYTGADTDVIIPTQINGLRVTEIGDSAFMQAQIVSVVIPDGVKNIAVYAFGYCETLERVELPSSLESVEAMGFYGCHNLKQIELPSGLKHLGEYSLGGCDLEEILLPEGLQTIGECAFDGNTRVTTIHIPASVTELNGGAFEQCFALESITIAANNATYEIRDDVVFTKDGRVLVRYLPNMTAAEYAVPAGVTDIGAYAFSDCKQLTQITLPDSLEHIGENAFVACINLTNLHFPDNLKSIGNGAFVYCPKFTSIVLPDSVTTIGGSAFSMCSGVTSIKLPEGLTTIANGTFSGCNSLQMITLPDSVKRIEDFAFNGCFGLTSVVVPEGVESIGMNSFRSCSKAVLTVVEGSYAHNWCIENEVAFMLSATPAEYFEYSEKDDGTAAITKYTGADTDVIIPAQINDLRVTEIGNSAFYNCSSLTSVVIPVGVESIGNRVFSGCSSLASVDIPEGVTNIGSEAFRGCGNLTSVVIPEGVSSIGLLAFRNCQGLTNIELPESLQSIEDWAFSGCSGLTSVDIPEGVTNIGKEAFRACSGLTSIEIPNGVTTIASGVFRECSSLKSMVIPEGVWSIAECAFYGCSSLESVDISKGVAYIYNRVFEGCSALSSINIPEGVRFIGDGAFSGCSGLTSIDIPTSVTNICAGTFMDCVSLEYIYIPEGVTNIGSYVFRGCSGLEKVSIPIGVTSICDQAFDNCSSLTSINLPDTIDTMGVYVFSGCPNVTVTVVEGSYAHNWCVDNGIAFALHTTPVEAFDYAERADGTVMITGYTGQDTHVIIPAEINGSKVTEIGDNAFARLPIVSVIIPEGVETIYEYAFSWSTDLEEVILPQSLQTIGNDAFVGCESLDSLEIPSCVNLGGYAFYGCSSLKTMVLPEGISMIGWGTFYGCTSLESIVLPQSMVTIEDTFDNCTALTSINLPTGVQYIASNAFASSSNLTATVVKDSYARDWCLENGVTYLYEGGIAPDPSEAFAYTLRDDGTLTITGYHGKDKDVVIPAEIGGAPVSSIGTYVFRNQTDIKTIAIPASVVWIDNLYTFYGCTNLTSIDVAEENEHYTSIDGVLYSKDMTELVVCPAGKVGELTVPEGVVAVANMAVAACKKLTAIHFPQTLTTIRGTAFEDCTGLTTIFLPKNVGYIANGVFADCGNLESIEVDAENPYFASADGVLYNADRSMLFACPNAKSGRFVVPESVNTLNYFAFRNCKNLTEIVLHDGIASMGEWVFFGCSSLTEIDLPANLTEIPVNAFRECKALESVVIPEGVTSIGFGAFWTCTNLESAVIPDSVTSIGEYAFDECSENLVIHGENGSAAQEYAVANGITFRVSQENCAHENSELYDVQRENLRYEDLPEEGDLHRKYYDLVNRSQCLDCGAIFAASVSYDSYELEEHTYESGACSMCGHENICTHENTYQYEDRRENEIAVPIEGDTEYHTRTYDLVEYHKCSDCSEVFAVNTTLGITEMRYHEFVGGVCKYCGYDSGCTHANAEAYESLVVKLSYTFETGDSCYDVSHLTTYDELDREYCPDCGSIYTISVKYGCERMESHEFADGVCILCGYQEQQSGSFTYEENALDPTTCTIVQYTGTDKVVVVPEAIDGYTVTRIGGQVFWGCGDMETITLPDSISVIGNNAFTDCGSLKSIMLPQALTQIGGSAFSGCSSLTSVTFPKGLKKIGSHAFYGCSTLKNLTIPDGVISIGEAAFQRCTGLTTVTLSASLTKIDQYVFSRCNSLLSVDIPESVTSIEYSAFFGCSSLSSVNIPVGVASIGGSAFSGCHSLSSVNIPESVTTIASSAFVGCSNLTNVTLPEGLRVIWDGTFGGCIALDSIVIPEGTTSIRSKAFASCTRLIKIVIPESVTSIADDCFDNTYDVTIYGASGSYAETFANEQGIPFITQA